MLFESRCESTEESIDPRVQVELERLNVATDEINRLEVNLDESRNIFRQLLSDSSAKIENCSRKLGHCIAKSRPYYDARLKAKEALRETQKMAAKFERANSAHAAAKEMVFLAEEGLKAEGRTFDHAWQEMLNHATIRVNESEADRTACESEHKRASQLYQLAEIRVQTLEKSLKKAISKSRPYFELKIYYNQLLEEQKNKVKSLEKQVADTKLCYAETLKNLEQISDEIHQSRHKNKNLQNRTDSEVNAIKEISNKPELKDEILNDGDGDGDGDCEESKKNYVLSPADAASSDSLLLKKNSSTSFSSNLDSDVWSESTDAELYQDAERDSAPSDNDSSLTEMQDSDSDDDMKPSGWEASKQSVNPSEAGYSILHQSPTTPSNNHEQFHGYGICSFPIKTDNVDDLKTNPESEWTEIKLSPEEEIFPVVQKRPISRLDDFDIPYAPLSELEVDAAATATSAQTLSETDEVSVVPDKSLASWISSNLRNNDKKEENETTKCVPMTPKKILNKRRQSLDVLWNAATGERMKEMLSQGISKLSIGALSERRNSEMKASDENKEDKENEDFQGCSSYDSNISSQFGLQFFIKKNKVEEEPIADSEKSSSEIQESLSSQIVHRKDKFFARKVPSPLGRTLSFLSADDDSASDTDSLPSVDMLTDEQLSALVLDQDFTELYQDILQ